MSNQSSYINDGEVIHRDGDTKVSVGAASAATVSTGAVATTTTTTTTTATAPFLLPDGRVMNSKNTLQSFDNVAAAATQQRHHLTTPSTMKPPPSTVPVAVNNNIVSSSNTNNNIDSNTNNNNNNDDDNVIRAQAVPVQSLVVAEGEIFHPPTSTSTLLARKSTAFWVAITSVILLAIIITGVVVGVGVYCGTGNCGGGSGDSGTNPSSSTPITISNSPVSIITPTPYTTLTPVVSPAPPTNPAIPVEIDVRGDQTLLLRHIINPINETVTVQLEYVGEAWVGFGFSNTFNMVPNIAVIGLPDEGTVLKYNMTSKVLDGVVPVPDEQQTLLDTSITQEGGVTTLQFTQYLNDLVDVPVTVGANTYIWAVGLSNPIGFHDTVSRGAAITTIYDQ